MFFVLTVVFTAMTVPALWLGATLVQAFDLPFVFIGLPVLLCLACAAFCLGKAESSR